MDLEHYRNFVTIVDSGNLSAAAEVLHVAQPALTAQVKNLQKKYGAELLVIHRGARSIALTDAGRVLYAKAKYLCSIEAGVQDEITSALHGTQGKLALSLSPSTTNSTIRNYLSGFARANPGVKFELYEGDSAAHTRELLSGQTEISICPLPLEQLSRFDIISTKREQLGAICHRDSGLLPHDRLSLSLADLAEVPLCLSRGCRELILSAFANAQLSPHILSVNSTKSAAIAWARQQIGVALVPVGIGEEIASDLYCRLVQDDHLTVRLTVSVVKHRPLSAVAQRFLKYFNEH